MKTSQVHTCRKYRNDKYRFNFGNVFTGRTIVAEPLPKDVPEEIKNQVL